MKKTTKILAVAITVAILFATLSIGAFAWDEEPYENETTLITTLNGDIFVCHSVVSIYDGYAYYETTVEFYVPYSNYFNEENFVEPYPNYVPSISTYDVAFNVLPMYKIFGEDEVFLDMYSQPVHRQLGDTHAMAANSEQYELESMTPYEYFATETFVVIRDTISEVDEVISCGVRYFWNLH